MLRRKDETIHGAQRLHTVLVARAAQEFPETRASAHPRLMLRRREKKRFVQHHHHQAARQDASCMHNANQKTWASFPSFPRASFQAPPPFFLSFFLSFFLLLFFIKYSLAHGRTCFTRRFTMDCWSSLLVYSRAISSAVFP